MPHFPSFVFLLWLTAVNDVTSLIIRHSRRDDGVTSLPIQHSRRDDDVTPVSLHHFRSDDDVSLSALMTLVQQQAATIQKQEASLQDLQNQVSVLAGSNLQALHNVIGDISRLEQSIANHSAALQTFSNRLNTQVFFTARMRTSIVSVGNASPMIFDDLVNSMGTGYNPHSGVFTVPVSGVYVFYAQLMKLGDTPPIHWVIDGSGSILCMSSIDAPNYDKSSCLAIARLQKGAHVFVRREMDGTPGSSLQGGMFCSFTGYLTSIEG